MMLAYGRTECNLHEARRIYQERYPDRRLPHHETFSTTYRRLRETGNLNFREPRVQVRQHNVQVDERILQAFDDDPTTSIRVVAAGLNISVWKVWSVLRADGRHAFHYTPVQGNNYLRTYLTYLKCDIKTFYTFTLNILTDFKS